MSDLLKKKFKILNLLILLIMISFTNNLKAKYEKNFFDHSILAIDGSTINLKEYKGKAVLIVNVASNCGFTKQYDDLQKLWVTYKNKGLIVLGIPSNQFGKQEPGTNDEIKGFCETNFNITFPMSSKINVKGEDAHEIYKWAKDNFGNSSIPKWNFHKILINKDGKIEETYASFTNPMSKKIISKINEILN